MVRIRRLAKQAATEAADVVWRLERFRRQLLGHKTNTRARRTIVFFIVIAIDDDRTTRLGHNAADDID